MNDRTYKWEIGGIALAVVLGIGCAELIFMLFNAVVSILG